MNIKNFTLVLLSILTLANILILAKFTITLNESEENVSHISYRASESRVGDFGWSKTVNIIDDQLQSLKKRVEKIELMTPNFVLKASNLEFINYTEAQISILSEQVDQLGNNLNSLQLNTVLAADLQSARKVRNPQTTPSITRQEFAQNHESLFYDREPSAGDLETIEKVSLVLDSFNSSTDNSELIINNYDCRSLSCRIDVTTSRESDQSYMLESFLLEKLYSEFPYIALVQTNDLEMTNTKFYLSTDNISIE